MSFNPFPPPEGGFDGFGRGGQSQRGRRKVHDYSAQLIHWKKNFQPGWKGPIKFKGELERPTASYHDKILPPHARPTEPGDTVPAKHLHTSLNKVKHPINVVRWTPAGRRLLTASTSGEFTLWNGTGFNFESIMQAHDGPIRAVEWTHNEDWMISADHDGVVKTWQPTLNNVNVLKVHKDPIRDLSFSCVDNHYATACDDGTSKLVDFWEGRVVTTLTGHGWDVKTVDFHPTKELILTGSKDHLVKLWDPRSGECFNTLHSHKNAITKVQWEKTMGNCFATAARDNTARVIDLRMFRDIVLVKGHEKDIATLTFHPVHSDMLTTAGFDGSVHHYFLDEPNAPEGHPDTLPVYDHAEPDKAPAQAIWPHHKVPRAHDMAVWSLDWHPVGHILATGSNDRTTRFWTRPSPGDTSWSNERFYSTDAESHAWDRRGGARRGRDDDVAFNDDADPKKLGKTSNTSPNVKIPGLSAAAAPAVPQLESGGPSTAGAAANVSAAAAMPLGSMSGTLPTRPPFLIPGIDPANPPRTFEEFTRLVEKSGVPIPPLGSFPPPSPPPPSMAGFPGFQDPPASVPRFPPPTTDRAGFPPAPRFAPSASAPQFRTPETQAPGIQSPGIQAQAPGFQAPGFQAPGFQAPGFQAPGFQAPGFQAPPGFPAPGFQTPGIQIPGFGTDAPQGNAGRDSGDGGGGGGGNGGAGGSTTGRRRAPLPSQEESLRMEQQKGNFTRPR